MATPMGLTISGACATNDLTGTASPWAERPKDEHRVIAIIGTAISSCSLSHRSPSAVQLCVRALDCAQWLRVGLRESGNTVSDGGKKWRLRTSRARDAGVISGVRSNDGVISVVRDNDFVMSLRPSEHRAVGQARVGPSMTRSGPQALLLRDDKSLPCLAVGRKWRTDPRGGSRKCPRLDGDV